MVILVMGVAGSGKTTVGTLLAKQLGWNFLDADDFHSPDNRDKMHRGIPLTDAERLPWLASIHEDLLRRTARGENIVLACSALRQAYRDILGKGLKVVLVFLRATPEQLRRNFRSRTHHFVGENLVPSQLASLEIPANALVEDISQSPQEIATEVCAKLGLD